VKPLNIGQQKIAAAMMEHTLQEHLRQRCLARGVRYYHTHRSKFSPAGYPDTTMVGLKGHVYAELKRVGEKPSPSQQAWIDDLRRVGVTVYVWTPEDLLSGEIDDRLEELGRRPPLTDATQRRRR
jgi:hypothetical protein